MFLVALQAWHYGIMMEVDELFTFSSIYARVNVYNNIVSASNVLKEGNIIFVC